MKLEDPNQKIKLKKQTLEQFLEWVRCAFTVEEHDAIIKRLEALLLDEKITEIYPLEEVVKSLASLTENTKKPKPPIFRPRNIQG